MVAESSSNRVQIAGLIPAAGSSQRMGKDKRRLPFRGRTMLEVTVDSLLLGGANPVVVVLEPDSPCRDLPGLASTVLVTNPAPSRGMLSSIRCGLLSIPTDAAAVAVLPGDHPFVPPEAVAALVAHYQHHHPLLLAPRYPDSRRGHPLLIDHTLWGEAADCDDDVGLRQLVRQRASDLEVLPLDFPNVEDDVDTPGDLQKLKTR